MPSTPGPKRGTGSDVRAARLAERRERADRCLDLFLRIRAVTPDPYGEHLLLWLDPKAEAPAQQPEP